MTIANHYSKTLLRAIPDFSVQETMNELRLFKKILYRKHGSKVQELKWCDAHDPEFPMLMAVIELLGCIPPTSVSCETTFSHMKLVKTSRRTRLQTSTLNDILMVKLQSPRVTEFDPTSSIDKWLSLALKPRLPNYQRAKKAGQSTNVIDVGSSIDITELQDLSENTDINNIPESMDKDTTDSEADEFQGSAENTVMDNDDMFALEEIYESKDDDENDHYCDEFRDEHDNWALMFELVRD
ncbi:uncharacterized protein LOC130046256 [Ostrea edulis]|uniref:uncharacterized protein LOC130046256 n=1 Tax=Ostrea edulis TaxID=37623 RepID=UPI0024AE96C0|nr:uncharacterized protein LOC130046256 [Ostrea edulis]